MNWQTSKRAFSWLSTSVSWMVYFACIVEAQTGLYLVVVAVASLFRYIFYFLVSVRTGSLAVSPKAA